MRNCKYLIYIYLYTNFGDKSKDQFSTKLSIKSDEMLILISIFIHISLSLSISFTFYIIGVIELNINSQNIFVVIMRYFCNDVKILMFHA